MDRLHRSKNQLIARLSNRFSGIREKLISEYEPVQTKGVPWTPLKKPVSQCKVALVTTSGVHHKDQRPFDMLDPNGDPSFRPLDADTLSRTYIITHDYFDHRDADRDLNVVFPLDRLREMESARLIGETASRHFSFMGHIKGPYIRTLLDETAPRIAQILKADNVDAVLLTPG